jgi:hypothetical protein
VEEDEPPVSAPVRASIAIPAPVVMARIPEPDSEPEIEIEESPRVATAPITVAQPIRQSAISSSTRFPPPAAMNDNSDVEIEVEVDDDVPTSLPAPQHPSTQVPRNRDTFADYYREDPVEVAEEDSISEEVAGARVCWTTFHSYIPMPTLFNLFCVCMFYLLQPSIPTTAASSLVTASLPPAATSHHARQPSASPSVVDPFDSPRDESIDEVVVGQPTRVTAPPTAASTTAIHQSYSEDFVQSMADSPSPSMRPSMAAAAVAARQVSPPLPVRPAAVPPLPLAAAASRNGIILHISVDILDVFYILILVVSIGNNNNAHSRHGSLAATMPSSKGSPRPHQRSPSLLSQSQLGRNDYSMVCTTLHLCH